MCGIAAIYDPVKFPAAGELRPMVDIQRHRGPDSAGLLVDGPAAIGMRRLAIIDTRGGDQPLYNEDRSLAVVLNGEIYNYIELQQSLRQRHRFATRSDTEVLLHLFEEHGCELLPLLNGMFAFALWDSRQRELLVARDRMGVKPLYFARIGSRWLFASELKALLAHPGVDTRLDPDALADYLRLGYIPRDATPYLGVRRLLPGHYLHVGPSAVRVAAWWNLADGFAAPDDAAPLDRQLVSRFDDSVRLRMRSDVPVASFLSGGLDSSLVTITAQRQSPVPMQTFTVAFDDTQFDETPYARAVAQQAATCHREVAASWRDSLALLPDLVWHLDEPLADSSIVPNYLVSRLASAHVKVCLSGLGGDELFGGYARYVDGGPGKIRKLFRHAPAAAGLIAPVVGRWHYHWGEELRLASHPGVAWRGYLQKIQIFDSPLLRQASFPANGRAEAILETLWNAFPGDDPLLRRQFVDQHLYLPDQILALTDRMSMANSLEVRVPFLDYRLVRLAQRIPGAHKQNAGDFKIILKNCLGDRCPADVLHRPKWGFDTPLHNWIARPQVHALLRRLPDGLLAREGLVRSGWLRDMVAAPQTVRRFARHLWSLLVLEIWLLLRGASRPPGVALGDLLGSAR